MKRNVGAMRRARANCLVCAVRSFIDTAFAMLEMPGFIGLVYAKLLGVLSYTCQVEQ
jgi:hypothetical protein